MGYVRYLLNGSPYSQKKNPSVRVIGLEDLNRQNLDVKLDYLSRTPQEFYSVFVDMLILSNSKCVSYGQGGYGEYEFVYKIGLTTYKFNWQNCRSFWGQMGR